MKRIFGARPDPDEKFWEFLLAFLWLAALSVAIGLLIPLLPMTGGAMSGVLAVVCLYGPTVIVVLRFNRFCWIQSEVLRWLAVGFLWFFQLFVMTIVLELGEDLFGWHW